MTEQADTQWFRIRAVLRCAFEEDSDSHVPVALPVASRAASVAARAALLRIDRGDTALRDVSRAIVDAIGALEQEVERLRLRLNLSEVGIALTKHLVEIGGDGMTIESPIDFPAGTRLRCWVEIVLDGREMIITTPAEVLASVHGTELRFIDTPSAVRDRIVAFAFQQQARGLRHAQ